MGLLRLVSAILLVQVLGELGIRDSVHNEISDSTYTITARSTPSYTLPTPYSLSLPQSTLHVLLSFPLLAYLVQVGSQ